MEQPKVSVIIPVYNAQKYLKRCLDSICGQTLQNIEIICINDGSNDNSPAILSDYEKKDKRIHIIDQMNQGAGAARNAGLSIATGQYISFVDADDFTVPQMLKRAYEKAISTESDLVVFDIYTYNHKTGTVSSPDFFLNKDLISDTEGFSLEDNAKYIFNFTSPTVWNKLFSHQFIKKNNLSYHNVKRCSADANYFAMMAVALASKISILDERLLYLRTNNYSSLTWSKEPDTEEMMYEWLVIKNAIVDKDIFNQAGQSFANRALEHFLNKLERMRTGAGFEGLYSRLRDYYFNEYGLENKPEEFFYSKRDYERYIYIKDHTPAQYLFEKLAAFKKIGVPNARFVFPYKMVDRNATIALYGAGEVGQAFMAQIIASGYCQVTLWVDKVKGGTGGLIQKPESLKKFLYDYVIIAIDSEKIAHEIKDYLMKLGVTENKIIWKSPHHEI